MIRQLKLTDYNEFLKLISEFRNTNFTYEEYYNFLNNNNNTEIWVYENNDCLLGTATLLIENKFIHNMGKVGHIEDVVISNELRGHGIGKILINFLINRGKELGCYKLVLNCENTIENFYIKCGFETSGIHMDYRF